MSRCICIFIVSLWTYFMHAKGINWHTSQAIIRRLYDLQNEQFTETKKYLALETERIHNLERTLTPVLKWYVNKSSIRNNNNHLNHLELIKRTKNYLPAIKQFLNNNLSMEVFKMFDNNKVINKQNIQSMYRSLRRLQKVYTIPASDMVAGKYKNRVISDPLNACESYVMSQYAFKDADMFGAIEWAIQAYNKWLIDQPSCLNIEKLIYYIKSASIYTGVDFRNLSNFKRFHHSKNTEKFTQHLSMMAKDLFFQNIETKSDIYKTYDLFEYHDRVKNFRHLCKTGESQQILTNNLKCRYQTKNLLYRIIMPFKEEDISNNPYLKLYHELIFDGEINTIISAAEKNLTDAMYYLNGNVYLMEEKRLGQLKWFSSKSDPILFGKLNDRVESLTGFSTETAEGFQTVNYGVGGHFTVHLDAFTDGPREHGNRLITVLFYMTDVPDDGYTIFPNINYVAHCRKGTALIWQNLYLNNGTVHSGTYHGGCPVLKGNKWIMTLGLYEDGQPLSYDWRASKEVTIV